jgi:hypothetical protein
VAAVVADRLGHKNTFDLVVDDLDLGAEHSSLVMEVALDVQWMVVAFESSWMTLKFLVASWCS